jgi:His-Xaa-Ser system radical SAM maturase HxsB
MLTYFKGQYNRYGPPDGRGYTLNEYFTYRLDEKHILLTTRHRAWVILEPREYELFLRHRVEEEPALYALLEDLGLILTPRNAEDIATIHCQRYAFLHRPPSLFIMVPTNRCNMACVYCHAQAQAVSRKEWDMSEETLYKTVDFFFSVPRQGRKEIRIEFQGGEPLLRYDLVQKAIDYTLQQAEKEGLDASFRLVSNLTLMSDEIARDIKARGNINLSSSLDGPPAVHDRQRVYPNGRGTYEDVVGWAEKLKEEYKIAVPFLPTFTRNAIGHEREIVDEYIERGVNSLYLRPVNYTGRAYERNYQEVGLTSEEVITVWKATLDYILERNKAGQPFRETETAYLLGNMLVPSHAFMCLRRPCGCGISQVTVGHDGTIHGCDGGRSVPMLIMGNVLTDTYDEVFTSDTAMALRTLAAETLPECQTCPFGPYCGYCVARGINQHGSPIPDVPLDFECHIYNEMLPYLFRRLLNREEAAILNSWV